MKNKLLMVFLKFSFEEFRFIFISVKACSTFFDQSNELKLDHKDKL